MAEACAYCHQVGGMQAGLDTLQCLYCGKLTNFDGTPGASVTFNSQRTVETSVGAPEPEGQHEDRRRRPGDPEPAADVAAPVVDSEPTVPPVTVTPGFPPVVETATETPTSEVVTPETEQINPREN